MERSKTSLTARNGCQQPEKRTKLSQKLFGVASAECRPITELEFQAQLQQFFDDTRLQIGFEFSGKYLAGMQMFRNWDHQAVLASFEHEVVAISWETTA